MFYSFEFLTMATVWTAFNTNFMQVVDSDMNKEKKVESIKHFVFMGGFVR